MHEAPQPDACRGTVRYVAMWNVARHSARSATLRANDEQNKNVARLQLRSTVINEMVMTMVLSMVMLAMLMLVLPLLMALMLLATAPWGMRRPQPRSPTHIAGHRAASRNNTLRADPLCKWRTG